MTWISFRRCLGSLVIGKKEFRLKGFIALEEINLIGKNKITDLICCINHVFSRQTCTIYEPRSVKICLNDI